MKRFVIAVCVLAGIFALWATPITTGQDRTEERIAALETRVAELESIVLADGDSSPSTPSAATYTLTGEISIKGDNAIRRLPNNECTGEGGFDDIREGADVTVRDEAGAIVAVDQLRTGTGTVICVFPFAVSDIPKRAFYSVEVSHRGELLYSFEDLEDADWEIALTLG